MIDLQLMKRLSPRELQVLNSFAEGLTTRQVAAKLGIAQQTVKSHLKSLRQRLGLKGGGLLALMHAVGLLNHGMTPLDAQCADFLAAEVFNLIQRKVIDSRSPAADALLDYLNGRDPHALERSKPA